MRSFWIFRILQDYDFNATTFYQIVPLCIHFEPIFKICKLIKFQVFLITETFLSTYTNIFKKISKEKTLSYMMLISFDVQSTFVCGHNFTLWIYDYSLCYNCCLKYGKKIAQRLSFNSELAENKSDFN